MVYDFLALSQEEKDLILSGKKTAQVYFHDFCGKEFKVGDKFVLLFPQDEAFGIVELEEARQCLFSDVNLNNEWPAAGFSTFDEIMQYGQRNHPNFQMDKTVLFVRWGKILLPEKTDERTSTKLIRTEMLLRAIDRAKGKGTVQ
jgi:hypothetical protein